MNNYERNLLQRYLECESYEEFSVSELGSIVDYLLDENSWQVDAHKEELKQLCLICDIRPELYRAEFCKAAEILKDPDYELTASEIMIMTRCLNFDCWDCHGDLIN